MIATTPPRASGIILVVGVSAVAWAAIFFRLAEGAPALTIAAYRMAIAAAAMLLIALAASHGRLPRPANPGAAFVVAASGIFLAGHFWAWFLSLNRTSVGSAVVIVAMQPLIAGLLGFFVLHERPSRNELIGTGIACVGLVIIGGRDLAHGAGAFGGDALALLGAVLAAAYRIAGRRLRSEMSTWDYSALVYVVAAVVLWLLVIMFRPAVSGFKGKAWLFIVLLALVPQVIGHTAFNWALAHFRVMTVSLVNMVEPVAATLIAIPVLHERPSAAVALGGPLIIIGVFQGLRRTRVPSSEP